MPISVILVLLSGCTNSQTYAIDVSCLDAFGGFDRYDPRDDNDTQTFSCYSKENFHIKCAKNTVQVIGDVILCKTHDEKNVRISLTHPDLN